MTTTRRRTAPADAGGLAAEPAKVVDERITKRRVVMVSYGVTVDDDGNPVNVKYEATDYVRPDFLDAYVAAAKARGVQHVEVSDEPDAGPGGYHGATFVPADLDHPLAGATFPATTPEG